MQKRKILIIDDDEAILYLLRKVFMRKGFEVAVARDGAEAIQELIRDPPALVITDLKTPSLSGEDLISAIRGENRDMPIIVMTAYPNLYRIREGENQVRAYFRKPFDIHEMVSSVLEIIEE